MAAATPWRPASPWRASALPDLAKFLDERIAPQLGAAPPVRELGIDAALAPGAATQELVGMIERAGPFGAGNALPRFALTSVRVSYAQPVGEGHVRCTLVGAERGRVEAIAFRAGQTALGPGAARSGAAGAACRGRAAHRPLRRPRKRAPADRRCRRRDGLGAGLTARGSARSTRSSISGPTRTPASATASAPKPSRPKVWPPKIADFVLDMESKILHPAPFSPHFEPGEHGGIYEFRTYTYGPGAIPKVIEAWSPRIKARTAISPLIFAGYTDIGPLNQWVHVWAYKNMGERERLRAQATTAGVWPPPRDASVVLHRQTSTFAIPAKFSPLR